MAVSQRDREHMRRLGEYKAVSHAEAAARHRDLPLLARLQRSWALFVAGRESAIGHDRCEDDPARFYELARRRGLYRP